MKEQDYPDNYRFFEGIEDPEEWQLIGIAVAYITASCEPGTIIDKNQALVWSQDQVLSMSKERYLKGKRV